MFPQYLKYQIRSVLKILSAIELKKNFLLYEKYNFSGNFVMYELQKYTINFYLPPKWNGKYSKQFLYDWPLIWHCSILCLITCSALEQSKRIYVMCWLIVWFLSLDQYAGWNYISSPSSSFHPLSLVTVESGDSQKEKMPIKKNLIKLKPG